MSHKALGPEALAIASNLLRENSEVYEKGFWENPSEPHHDLLMDFLNYTVTKLHHFRHPYIA